MNNNGGNYVYAIGLDTAAFAQSVDRAKRLFQGLGDTATAAGEEADEAFNKMKNSIASVAAGVSLGMLAKKVAEVRGEVQQLEVAFETMLGSKQKADALMAQMVELAAKTPFGLQDVSKGAKQLLAFGSASEEVAEEITMLGDIAAGLSIPLGDLIYLYGTTRTQGKLFTIDLKQFMGRGIPLAEELAKAMSKTTDEVMELVSAGRVGFPEVQKALQGMTSEGGQFGGLMEKQAQTIAGQINVLGDEIYQMFNKIGESNEGLISLVLSGASTIVENYEKILDILTALIAAYGAYKAAIILTAAKQKAMLIAQEAQAFFQLAKGVKSAQEAMLLLNAATRKNPWGLVLSVIAAVGAAIWTYCESTEEATEATDEFSSAIEGTGIGAQITQVNELGAAYKKLGEDMNARRKFIEENKSAFDELGFAVTNVAEADDLLIKNTPKYVEALKTRAKASAARKLADEKYEQAFKAGVKREREEEILKGIPEEKLQTWVDYDGGVHESWVTNQDYIDQKNAYLAALKEEEALYAQADKYFEQSISLNNTSKPAVSLDKNLAEAYRTAQQAWLDAKAAIAEANKNRANYTEEQYKQLAEELDAAEKRFKELGGNTSSKAQSIADKDAKAAAELALKHEYEAQQATINMMAEGTEKKVAQIELDYRKRADAITKAEAELVAKQGTALTEAQQALFQTMREGSASEYADAMNAAIFGDTDAEGSAAIQKMEAERKAWNKYLEEYGTFQEKLKAVTIRYNEAIANAQTEGERKTLEAERDAALAAFEVQASAWAKDLANKSIAELNKMMQELEKQVEAKQEAFDALESSDSAEAKDYLKTINELKAKIAELKKQLNESNKAVSKDKWAEATQVFQNIGSAATDAAEGIAEFDEGLADALRSIAQLASSTTNMIGAIQGVMTAFKEGLSGIEKASAILAVVGAAIQLVSGIVEAFNGGEEAARAATLAALEYARALERISNIQLRESFSNYFGTDNFGRFTALLGKTREQLQEMNAITKELDQNWIGETGVDYSASLDAYSANRRAQAALIKQANEADIQLVADMRSGWQKFWGTGYQNVDVKDLKDFYDEDGILNVDKLKAYYDNYAQYLSAEQKELIESLINTGEEYAANLAEINSYMQDIFGDLGASITDSLVDAFRNGTDAAVAMGDAVGDVLEQIAKDMAHAAFIQPLLEQAQDGIDALNKQRSEGKLSDEEYMRQLIAITDTLMDDAQAAGEGLNAYLEYLQQMANEKGHDIFTSDSAERSAQSKGIAQASQDSVNELNGRMTAIQGHTYSLVEGQRQLINDSAQVLRHLAGIESNTAELRHMRLDMSAMHKDMSAMRSDISDIATRGIITR